MALIAINTSYQSLRKSPPIPTSQYKVGKSEFTLVTMQTQFTLVLLFIDHCTMCLYCYCEPLARLVYTADKCRVTD